MFTLYSVQMFSNDENYKKYNRIELLMLLSRTMELLMLMHRGTLTKNMLMKHYLRA